VSRGGGGNSLVKAPSSWLAMLAPPLLTTTVLGALAVALSRALSRAPALGELPSFKAGSLHRGQVPFQLRSHSEMQPWWNRCPQGREVMRWCDLMKGSRQMEQPDEPALPLPPPPLPPLTPRGLFFVVTNCTSPAPAAPPAAAAVSSFSVSNDCLVGSVAALPSPPPSTASSTRSFPPLPPPPSTAPGGFVVVETCREGSSTAERRSTLASPSTSAEESNPRPNGPLGPKKRPPAPPPGVSSPLLVPSRPRAALAPPTRTQPARQSIKNALRAMLTAVALKRATAVTSLAA